MILDIPNLHTCLLPHFTLHSSDLSHLPPPLFNRLLIHLQISLTTTKNTRSTKSWTAGYDERKFPNKAERSGIALLGLLQRLPPINASLPISDETIDIHVYLVSYIVSAEKRRRCGTIILQCPCYAGRAGTIVDIDAYTYLYVTRNYFQFKSKKKSTFQSTDMAQ